MMIEEPRAKWLTGEAPEAALTHALGTTGRNQTHILCGCRTCKSCELLSQRAHR